MPALTNRQAARVRLQQMFASALDRFVPLDESVPLKGKTFLDFENQVDEVGKPLLAAMMEERAALDETAEAREPGRCPYCGSDRVYLKKAVTQGEFQSPHGPVILRRQHARCRACNGSFSPAGQRMGVAE